MEKISGKAYVKPNGTIQNLRTSIICSSSDIDNVTVGDKTNNGFDARKRVSAGGSSLD